MTTKAKDLQWGDRLALSNYKPEFARAYRFPGSRTVKKVVIKNNPNGKPVAWVHMDDGHPQVYFPDKELTLEGKAMNEGPSRPGFEQRAEQFRALVEKKKAEHMKKEFPTLKPPKYTFDKGSKYWRMVEADDTGHRHVFCFLNAENGDVLKAAGWKAPVTKNPRGNIFDADLGIGGVGAYGAKYVRGGPNYPFAGESIKLSTIARSLMGEGSLTDPIRYHHWKIQQVTPTAWRVIDTKKGTTKMYHDFADVKDALGINPNDLPFSVDTEGVGSGPLFTGVGAGKMMGPSKINTRGYDDGFNRRNAAKPNDKDYMNGFIDGQEDRRREQVPEAADPDEMSPERERQERDKEDYLRQQQSGVKDESLQEDSWSYRKHDARVAEGTRARLFAYDLPHGIRVEANTVYNGRNWRRSPIQLEISQNGKMIRNESHANRRLANESFRRLKRKLREIARTRRNQLREKKNAK